MNPKYEGTFVFPNDFPALQPDAPEPGNLSRESRLPETPRLRSWGGCKVVWRSMGAAAVPCPSTLSVLPQVIVIIPCFERQQRGVCGEYPHVAGVSGP